MSYGELKFIDLIKKKSFDDITADQIKSFLKIANREYRLGAPIIYDHVYDDYMELLSKLSPEDPFLKSVEPEPELIEGKTVKLPAKMLSTQKAYSMEEIKKWVDRVLEAASYLGISADDVHLRVTPKLDGFAAYDDGKRLYTRGNGVRGTDITRVFERGMGVARRVCAAKDTRCQGPGEIVVSRRYFDLYLSEEFENSRNVISSIIKEHDLDDRATSAIKDRAVLFYPFSELPSTECNSDQLIDEFEVIKDWAWRAVGYDTDGMVIECVNEDVKSYMGHTNHHHRWQIAFKENTEFAEVKVLSITSQTGKTGKITPVAELEPTKLSGAEIRRVTCHHYGNVIKEGIGSGAVVKIVRSGLVIPKIEEVVKTADKVIVPNECPSCGSDVEWEGDFLQCTNNSTCSAQIESTIEYFFKTLGNCDGFGPKVIEKLCSGNITGVKKVTDVYQLDIDTFMAFGFGEKTSHNLYEELNLSRSVEIEDWRFLASFSIHNVGKGGCERLLRRYRLEDIFELTVDQIIEIDGFAEKTATTLVDTLKRIKPDFDFLYKLGFNLSITPLISEQDCADSSISGKTIVFTGSMKSGSRDEMKKSAKAMGAIVGTSVTGNTDYLVIGEKAAKSKIDAAENKGVAVIAEDEYFKIANAE